MTTQTINVPKLPEHHRQWFEQLIKAAKNNELALVSSLDAETLQPRSVIALVNREQGGMVQMLPIGHLCPDDPFKAYIPPETEVH